MTRHIYTKNSPIPRILQRNIAEPLTLAELGMPSIPSLLPVPRIQDALTPAGEPTDPNFEKRAERFFREFEWYAEALRAGRFHGAPY